MIFSPPFYFLSIPFISIPFSTSHSIYFDQVDQERGGAWNIVTVWHVTSHTASLQGHVYAIKQRSFSHSHKSHCDMGLVTGMDHAYIIVLLLLFTPHIFNNFACSIAPSLSLETSEEAYLPQKITENS
jgi:hypothetical protein